MNEKVLTGSHFKVVIPARYDSSRFPGKLLKLLAGKPLIQHAYERAVESGAEEVIVATDDQRVQTAAEAFAAQVLMTSVEHQSGTDRICEVAERLGWADETLVVNLQADEPMMPGGLIRQAAQALADDAGADIATLKVPLAGGEEYRNPNVVKVVCDKYDYALYFSRAPIPWIREGAPAAVTGLPQCGAWWHIGLYAYRVATLKRYRGLTQAGLEACEALEQLRAQWNGMRIKVVEALESPPTGVNTEQDLQRLKDELENG